jgi:hypothetical protein
MPVALAPAATLAAGGDGSSLARAVSSASDAVLALCYPASGAGNGAGRRVLAPPAAVRGPAPTAAPTAALGGPHPTAPTTVVRGPAPAEAKFDETGAAGSKFGGAAVAVASIAARPKPAGSVVGIDAVVDGVAVKRHYRSIGQGVLPLAEVHKTKSQRLSNSTCVSGAAAAARGHDPMHLRANRSPVLHACHLQLDCSRPDCRRVHGAFEPKQTARFRENVEKGTRGRAEGMAACAFALIGACPHYDDGKCQYRHWTHVVQFTRQQVAELTKALRGVTVVKEMCSPPHTSSRSTPNSRSGRGSSFPPTRRSRPRCRRRAAAGMGRKAPRTRARANRRRQPSRRLGHTRWSPPNTRCLRLGRASRLRLAPRVRCTERARRRARPGQLPLARAPRELRLLPPLRSPRWTPRIAEERRGRSRT